MGCFQNIDARIFGVPSRIENIRKNQAILRIPEDRIFIDERRDGCVKTALRAWTHPTDKEFVLVLADDAELCDDFAKCCERIVHAMPDKIISLFPLSFMGRENVLPWASTLQSPYISLGSEGASGLCIIMRSEWIQDCTRGWLTSGLNGDDTNINLWAKNTGVDIVTTIPSTIQHIGDVSVFDQSRSIGRTELYRKDAAKANFENNYLNVISNFRG